MSRPRSRLAEGRISFSDESERVHLFAWDIPRHRGVVVGLYPEAGVTRRFSPLCVVGDVSEEDHAPPETSATSGSCVVARTDVKDTDSFVTSDVA